MNNAKHSPVQADQVLQQYRHIAVVGSGLIGSAWAALFLAHGLHVRIYDPRPDVESVVDTFLQQAIPTLQALGFETGSLRKNLSFASDLESAVEGCDLVQESGPENLAVKQEVFARIGRKADPKALLLSSTSTFCATEISRDMDSPGRMLIGHPFVPPYLVPLVEVVPGEKTAPAAVAEAMAFYRALGKKPVALRKEIAGFVVNRLQAVLLGEAINLVLQGVVTVDELDETMTSSIGPRWASAGIFQSSHIAGGAGGVLQFLHHFGPAFEDIWKDSGKVHLDEATDNLVAAQVDASFGKAGVKALAATRSQKQFAILKTLRGMSEGAKG